MSRVELFLKEAFQERYSFITPWLLSLSVGLRRNVVVSFSFFLGVVAKNEDES